MVYRGREHHEKTRNKGTRVGAVVSIQVDQGRGEGRGGEGRDRERLGGGGVGVGRASSMTAAAVFNNRHLTHKNQIPVLISGLCFATTTHSTPLHPTPAAPLPTTPSPGKAEPLAQIVLWVRGRVADRISGSYFVADRISDSYFALHQFIAKTQAKVRSGDTTRGRPGTQSTIRRYDPGPAADPKYDLEIRSRAGRGLGDTIWRRPPYPNYDPGQGSLAHTHGHENL